MKKVMKIFLCSLLSALSFKGWGQSHKLYTIQPGEKITWVIPIEDQYAYAQFKPGIVFFKDKTTGGGNMNYSHLSQEMFFIDPKGDTLTLSNPADADSVLIGNEVFYNTKDDGFIKADTIAGQVIIGRNDFFYISNKQVVGLYGQPTNSSGNDRANRFRSNFAAASMVAQDIITLSRKHVIYAGRRFNNLQPVTKKNLSNIFGKQQSSLSLYLQQNEVNFLSRADVLKLVNYLNTQQ
jgi:hypothetical protein